ncbi:hypothetical protein EOD41_06010 [Mucilaginibacter limnophilus]|uniref:HEAT repeat domain-containing protein n=1 Tax=Mucilaginibacter limnophilus TaxID=1932778 RepID=A0A437MV34_9SPHI|nr:hypothetical protein [Mucilaginibacter limnophilus]RVU01518.1 hypothetical protein EOD41_06010 [Mucilaginibacter limnophilus]
MKRIGYFLFLLFLSLSCYAQTTGNNVQLRPDISKLAKEIAKENRWMSRAVGYAGTRPAQWDRFEKLREQASPVELRALTGHENPVVRCYAFYALSLSLDTAVYTILLNHLTDTSKVSTLIGCLGSSQKVGDFFYSNAAVSGRQRYAVDSILLFNDSINLYAKWELLNKIKPEQRYYHRIKELALSADYPIAIEALAKYRDTADVEIIKKAFKKEGCEGYAISAAIAFPAPEFYSYLTASFEEEWSRKSYSYPKWRALYQALAQYPNEKTLSLFNKTLTTKDKFKYQTLSKFLLIAITKFPHELFEPLNAKVKLDDYEMAEVKEEINRTY